MFLAYCTPTWRRSTVDKRETVYVTGEITRFTLTSIMQAYLRHSRLHLVIDSRGGHAAVALEALTWLQQEDVDAVAEIVNADSAAALIALGCKKRVMHHDGIMMLHLCAKIEKEESFPELCERRHELNQQQVEFLRSLYPFVYSPEFRSFQLTNEIYLRSDRAWELGLVHSIIPATEKCMVT